MNKEEELDMNELIESFGECSTDYTKTACTYYANYLEEYQKEKIRLEEENKELHNKIDKAIKRIELLGKFDGKRCTRNFKMMSADFNYLLEILKDSDVDE